MKKMPPGKQAAGLLAHAAQKKSQTEEKVDRIIDEMKRYGQGISFTSVAKKAGVSRTTLYSHERLRERIQGLSILSAGRKTGTAEPYVPAARLKVPDKMLELRNRIKRLESDKKKLLVQLVDYHDVKQENAKLRKQLQKQQEKG